MQFDNSISANKLGFINKNQSFVDFDIDFDYCNWCVLLCSI